MNQTTLLGDAHAFHRANESTRAAQANFNKYQGCAVQHYQIELAATHIEITRHEAQPVALEMIQCDLFS